MCWKCVSECVRSCASALQIPSCVHNNGLWTVSSASSASFLVAKNSLNSAWKMPVECVFVFISRSGDLLISSCPKTANYEISKLRNEQHNTRKWNEHKNYFILIFKINGKLTRSYAQIKITSQIQHQTQMRLIELKKLRESMRIKCQLSINILLLFSWNSWATQRHPVTLLKPIN